MTFRRYDNDGKVFRYKKAVIDCSEDEIITEQSHRDEVDINNIVKRHGIDLLQKVNALQQPQWDEDPLNDFQEAMQIVTKAQSTFDQLPSDIRRQFNNSPAEFVDFVQNPNNIDAIVEMGLATRIPEIQPTQVEIVNQAEPENPSPETPPA